MPETELPDALRRRFGGGEADLPKGVVMVVDHTEGLSLGATALHAASVGVMGVLTWGGFSALYHSVSIGVWSITRGMFWGIWFMAALLVLALTVAGAGLAIAALLRSIWVQNQLDQGSWPYGLFLLPQALILRTEHSCHILPRQSIHRTLLLRSADMRQCPGVEVATPDGGVRDFCLEGIFGPSAEAINREIDRWLDHDNFTHALQIVPDKRPELTEGGTPPESDLDNAVKMVLRGTPKQRAASRWDTIWHQMTGRNKPSQIEGHLAFESGVLSLTSAGSEPVTVALDKPFSATLTATLISKKTAELNVSLRQRGAPPTAPSLQFRTRLPQSAIGASIPLKEEGFAYIDPDDFRRLWPAIAFGAAAVGAGPFPVRL